MPRRSFNIHPIRVNGRKITRVIVDSHLEKHRDVTDDVILGVVGALNGVEQEADEVAPPYEYFVTFLHYRKKRYRLVWLLEEDELYIGVLTVYRDDRRK